MDMSLPKVQVVFLRQPRLNDPRSDPYYEFGSFGCTGCHRNNLMHPKRRDQIEGSRFAFVQGGKDEIRLILVTPPIWTESIRNVEARWDTKYLPLIFSKAPLFINNGGFTDVPSIKTYLKDVRRKTYVARAASKFRTRTSPVDQDLGQEIILAYEEALINPCNIADNYVKTLPFGTNNPERNREAAYEQKRYGM